MRSGTRLSVRSGLLLGCLSLLYGAPGAEPLCAHFTVDIPCDFEQALVIEPSFDVMLARVPRAGDPLPPPVPQDIPETAFAGIDPPVGPPLPYYDPWEQGLAFEVPPSPGPQGAGQRDGAPATPVYKVDDHPKVRKQLEGYLTGDRRIGVEQLLGRSARYVQMVQGVLRDHGLPEDLFATVMIESGFNPAAVSRAGAKGLWQFMATTARRYGLRVDRWVDERLDPEKSTRAAARYLRDLYAMFGSWPLVHAAYNAGEGRVSRAMQVLRTADFWELARGALLAEETKNFVVAVQAAALIFREPERYGFFSLAPEVSPRYRTIEVPPGTSLARLALRAGVGPDVLHELNPELRLGQTPPDQVHRVKVPGHLIFPPRTMVETDVPKGKGRARAPAGAARPVRRDPGGAPELLVPGAR
jgi:Transglycosylase SLT domain